MQSWDCAPGGMSKGSLITVTRKTVRSPPLSPARLLQPVAAAISMVPLPPFFWLTLRSVPFVSVAPLLTLLQPAWRAITAVSMVPWQWHPCFRPPPPWGSIIPTAVSMWGPESWGRRTPPIMVSPPRPPVTKVSWAAVFWWTAQASWIMWMPCIPVWRWRIMLPPLGPLLLTTTGIWWIAVTLTRTIPKGASFSWHMLSILPRLLPWTIHELFIITWSVTHMQSSGTPSPSPRKPKWFAINITSLDIYSKTQGEAVCNSQLLLFYTPSGASTMHGERCIIRHTSETKKQAKKKNALAQKAENQTTCLCLRRLSWYSSEGIVSFFLSLSRMLSALISVWIAAALPGLACFTKLLSDTCASLLGIILLLPTSEPLAPPNPSPCLKRAALPPLRTSSS